MKSILFATLVFLSSHAFAAADCSMVTPSQRPVIDALKTYAQSGLSFDADIYIGQLIQFEADVEIYADKNNPNYGNDYSMDIYESSWSVGCAEDAANKIEKRALSGDRVAIRVMLMYSAVYMADGAGAEDLADFQAALLKKYPKTTKAVEKEYAAFFKIHPINWITY